MAEATGEETTSPTAAEPVPVPVPQARDVVYCGVCTLPPEYCEYGGTVERCKEWLEKNHPEMYQRLYSDATLTANLTPLSADAQERADKDASKKANKAKAQAAADEKRRRDAKVQIKRVERNKRKFVTAITGLDAHDLDLKKCAKDLGKQFATGSSVSKLPAPTPAGITHEIIVQGDLADAIMDWIATNHPAIPEANVEVVEDKKKKT